MLTREVCTFTLVLKVLSIGVVVAFLLDPTAYIGCC
jgi:hypothetical protein